MSVSFPYRRLLCFSGLITMLLAGFPLRHFGQNAPDTLALEVIDSLVYDHGRVTQDMKPQANWRIYNPNFFPVRIQSFKISAGYAAPILPPDRLLPPGDTTVLGSVMNPAGKKGKFVYTGMLELSISRFQPIIFRVNGVVVGMEDRKFTTGEAE